MLSRDLWKFVSEKKMVMERFNCDHTITLAKWELKFETPDKITSKMKWKGVEDTWDNAEVSEWTFIRVKNYKPYLMFQHINGRQKKQMLK